MEPMTPPLSFLVNGGVFGGGEGQAYVSISYNEVTGLCDSLNLVFPKYLALSYFDWVHSNKGKDLSCVVTEFDQIFHEMVVPDDEQKR